MAPKLLSDTWERWAPAVTYLINQQFLPIHDHEKFQSYINSELKKGNSIRLDDYGCQFIIDLIETSPGKCDIVAFSVVKFFQHSLTGGEVITELPANYPRDSDHVELIRGMETVSIARSGNIQPMCCREGWMKASQKDFRHPRAIAETSRQKIVKVATERKIQTLKLTQMEPERKSPAAKTGDLEVNDELNRNLSALCKKAATLLASKGEYKTTTVDENISTQDAISFISKVIDDLQHWAPSGPFHQARHKGLSKKVTPLKPRVKIKQRHSQEKLQLESEVRRITEEKEQLEKINGDLKSDVELFRSRAKDAKQELEQLTGQNSADANGEELAENSAHQSTTQLQEAFQQPKEIQGHAELDSKDEQIDAAFFDEDELEDELEKAFAEELGKTAKNEDAASKESGKLRHVSQLETELQTTKDALKNKTEELALATEQHARELVEAGGSKEKCRCKNKEAYVESLEEHVEKLRGTMEDVLRHVSTYQGRKRRRTEGPDFEY
ncbi:hypothetical protein CKAH01_15934 [Colletotrichum kahawae]|uniref:Uncharacterized protein n=1 Tax=Colletotrichum kahawae TaxID=34407 RepID=A0AAD9YH28_COLKA|nr:hypothetical protein CKAH01_15934 [Colletotrichum kahawae]